MLFINKDTNYSDKEILEGLICQDKRVLQYLYYRHFPEMKAFVLSNSGSESEAEDLFQDVMMILFEKCRRGGLVLTGSFASFIFVLSRNRWFNQLRRRKLQPRTDEALLQRYSEEAADLLPDQQTMEQLEKERVFHACFSALGKECKKVLLLFIEGNSIADITRMMGYNSEQHTKNRRYRCKLSLFRMIKTDPRYRELVHETRFAQDNSIPRW